MAKPVNVKNDHETDIASGGISGVKLLCIPGRKDSIGTANLEDITQTGNTVMVRPAGVNTEIVSSSDADNGATATGVLTVEIEYLDSNGDEARVTKTLDGTTAINIGTILHDIQWMHTVTVGSNTVAEGNIQIRDVATGAIIYEQINAGGNQSLSGRYKVPNKKTGYLMGWQASAITRKIDFRLRADVNRATRELQSGVFNFQDALVLEQTASGWIPLPSLKIPALGTVKGSAISFTGTGDAGIMFCIKIIDD